MLSITIIYTLMKKTLFAGMLVASQLCSAQRFLENTNGSWTQPDLSVETFQNNVIAGFTEVNPSTGRLTPTFKFTTLTGAPMNSFYINLPGDYYLMDFTINPQTQTLIMACMTTPSSSSPNSMVLVEANFGGGIMQIWRETVQASTWLVPQEIIYSSTSSQVVVVGTALSGPLTAANTYNLPKKGFILAVRYASFNAVSFYREINTPQPSTTSTDSDMLAGIAEVPGTGYFTTGSCNNATVTEQNMLNAGFDYAGASLFSMKLDNTTSRMAGASVIFTNGRIYVLSNNSLFHTFQLGSFNPVNGAPTSTFYRYPITGLPIGSGVDENGFRLQQTQNGELMVSGYLNATSTAILPQRLTPFHMLIDPGFGFVYAQMYQSGNNVTMPPYFDEGGSSVYINTPDMFVYSPASSRSYIVNPNSVAGGYDLSITNPINAGGCERKLAATVPTNQPANLGPAIISQVGVVASVVNGGPMNRVINQSLLCDQAFIAAAPATVTATATIFPNPAKDQLNIELESDILSITVTDMKGTIVLTAVSSERNKTKVALDVSGLKPGVYLLDITTSEGIVQREKFIKE